MLLTLYGYHTNYGNIQNKNLCIIGESEKFTQQLDSFGCYLGLASCGCHLSDTQAKYIKGLLVDKTILAYDEGLEEEYIREEAKKLKVNNTIFNNKVGYVYDRENIIIPKGNFFLLLLIISLPFLSSTKPANAGLYFSYCFG